MFPDRDFDVTQFGAVGDSKVDCTEAFRKAIAACHAAKGGRVVVPAGKFLTGAVRLKSNVNLHISAGATVLFTRDVRKYPLVFTRWEGIELMNYSPFIYGFEEENIGITGQGTIDGNADCEHWWPWKGRTKCGWKEGRGQPDTGPKSSLCDGREAYTCHRKSFWRGALPAASVHPAVPLQERADGRGVTLKNSPMWQVHPVLCTNVSVLNMTITGADHWESGPNTDGCDPESCTDVLIKGCNFNTGDDCIALSRLAAMKTAAA